MATPSFLFELRLFVVRQVDAKTTQCTSEDLRIVVKKNAVIYVLQNYRPNYISCNIWIFFKFDIMRPFYKNASFHHLRPITLIIVNSLFV
jgi:hypothetical protein